MKYKIYKKITFIFAAIILLVGCVTKNKFPQQKMDLKEKVEVTELNPTHYQTYTDIVIDAPIEKVWAVLTDFDAMMEWSSSFKGIDGELINGAKVTVPYLINGTLNKVPHTLIYEEGVEYGWSDSLGGPFIGLKDNHRFRVEKISSAKTRFIQTDDFVTISDGKMSSKDMAGFVSKIYPVFNKELKQQVEALLKKR